MNLYFINHGTTLYISKLITHVWMCGTFIQALSVLLFFLTKVNISPLIAKAMHFHCCAHSITTVKPCFEAYLKKKKRNLKSRKIHLKWKIHFVRWIAEYSKEKFSSVEDRARGYPNWSTEEQLKKMERSFSTCGTILGGLTCDFCLKRREREAEKKNWRR